MNFVKALTLFSLLVISYISSAKFLSGYEYDKNRMALTPVTRSTRCTDFSNSVSYNLSTDRDFLALFV